MDARQFNSIFKELESDINNLYEKIRVLEDIKNYTKDFVIRAIEERRKKIVDSLKVIETNVTEYQNPDYQAVEIGFSNVSEKIKDRDGSSIQALQNVDGALTTPHKVLSQEILQVVTNLGQTKKMNVVTEVDGSEDKVKEYVLFSDAEPFNESKINVLEDSNTFRSVYESDRPLQNGLFVEYDMQFSGKSECNYFDLSPVNCEINSIVLTSADNSTLEINPNNKFFTPAMNIAKAKIRVHCSKYEREIVQMPSDSQGDAFDKSIVGSEMVG